MNWNLLFLSFKGRIGRWDWWIGTILIVMLDYAISISALWGLGGDPNYYWNDALPTKEVALADSIAFLATLHFSLAVDIKRIHDRGRSAYFLIPLYLSSLTIILLQSFNWDQAIIWTVTKGVEEKLPFEVYVLGAFFVVMLAYSLWMIIELGILRGTSGNSKYGPDPLAPLTPPGGETN